MHTVYTSTARRLHWLMAALIIGLLGLGLYMHELPLSPLKLELYSWHKWLGVTAFILACARIGWRLTHRPPPLPESIRPGMRRLAHVGHSALYLLMVAIPLTGWLMSSAKGFQTVWFGLIPIPDLLGRDRALGDLLQQFHKILNLALMLTIAGHVAAGLWHHFILKDGTLARMRIRQPQPHAAQQD